MARQGKKFQITIPERVALEGILKVKPTAEMPRQKKETKDKKSSK